MSYSHRLSEQYFREKKNRQEIKRRLDSLRVKKDEGGVLGCREFRDEFLPSLDGFGMIATNRYLAVQNTPADRNPKHRYAIIDLDCAEKRGYRCSYLQWKDIDDSRWFFAGQGKEILVYQITDEYIVVRKDQVDDVYSRVPLTQPSERKRLFVNKWLNLQYYREDHKEIDFRCPSHEKIIEDLLYFTTCDSTLCRLNQPKLKGELQITDLVVVHADVNDYCLLQKSSSWEHSALLTLTNQGKLEILPGCDFPLSKHKYVINELLYHQRNWVPVRGGHWYQDIILATEYKFIDDKVAPVEAKDEKESGTCLDMTDYLNPEVMIAHENYLLFAHFNDEDKYSTITFFDIHSLKESLSKWSPEERKIMIKSKAESLPHLWKPGTVSRVLELETKPSTAGRPLKYGYFLSSQHTGHGARIALLLSPTHIYLAYILTKTPVRGGFLQHGLPISSEKDCEIYGCTPGSDSSSWLVYGWNVACKLIVCHD